MLSFNTHSGLCSLNKQAMGVVNSNLRSAYLILKALYTEISNLNKEYSALLSRVTASPGIPCINPTTSFWLLDPPHPELATIQSPALPDTADIVIIGSGITGCAVAKTLLDECHALGIRREIVILDARDLCSGATGRNGGHIKCSPYDTYSRCRRKLSPAQSKKIVEFQKRHVDVLTSLAAEAGWDSAECREVETVDMFFDEEAWRTGLKAVQLLSKEWPEEKEVHVVWEKRKACERFKCSDRILGAITSPAGALWPYRFVTECFWTLLDRYPSLLKVETNTPVLDISTDQASEYPFMVKTPRGTIVARHVLHATNSHAANLLPSLRSKLFSVRGQMSAQRPGLSFPSYDGKRSWSFINRYGFEYVTQRPERGGLQDCGLLMAGGGLFQSAGRGLDEIGVAKDDDLSHMVGSHLAGVLPMAFGSETWGEEPNERRIQNMWTGTMGFTTDGMPLVGRLDTQITGRPTTRAAASAKGDTNGAVEPGEWICAGYNGEGMVHAWLCGRAVALQILGRENVFFETGQGSVATPTGVVDDWLPEEFSASVQRIRGMDFREMSIE